MRTSSNAVSLSETNGKTNEGVLKYHSIKRHHTHADVANDGVVVNEIEMDSEKHGEVNNLMEGDQHQDDDKDLLPIDRGWAWFVLAGCLLNSCITLGYLKSLSVLFVEYLRIFGASVTTTTLILGVFPGTFSISAIFTMHVLVVKIGVRKTVLLGGAICTVGMVAAIFAPNIVFLICVHCVLLGIGQSMVLAPGLLLLGHYFKRRRGFAMAVAMSGFSIGGGVFPVFTRLLLDFYGIRGTMLIYTGLTMNIFVGASLYRPLEFYRRRQRRTNNGAAAAADDDLGTPGSDNCVNVNAVDEIPDKPSTKSQFSFVLTTPSGMNVVITEKPEPTSDLTSALSGSLGTYKESLLSTLNHNHLPRKRTVSACSRNSQRKMISSSEFFLYSSNPDIMSLSIADLTNIDTAEEDLDDPTDTTRDPCCSAFLDFSLLKLPMFHLFFICSQFGIPQNLTSYYFPALAMERGVDKTDAVLLLLITGVLDFFSRMLLGVIVDMKVLKIHQIMAIGLICVATVAQFNQLYTSYPLLVMFAVSNGIFGSSYHCLVPVLIVDFMGLDLMGKTLGFSAMFHGFSAALTHPILGSIKDASGSYAYCYCYIGATSYVAAVLLLVGEPIARRRARSRTLKEQDMAAVVARLQKSHL